MALLDKNAGTPPPGLQMVLAIGIVFLALFNGGLITMGVTCISLLSPKECNSTKRRMFWRAYIVVLLILNIGFLTATFILSYRWIIYHSRPTKEENTSKALSFFADLTALLILCLTDGFLVSVQLVCLYTTPLIPSSRYGVATWFRSSSRLTVQGSRP